MNTPEELAALRLNNLLFAFQSIIEGKLTSISFEFKKVDGTIRNVRATLRASDEEEFSSWDQRPGLITFFDLDSDSWKSCRMDSILEITGWN